MGAVVCVNDPVVTRHKQSLPLVREEDGHCEGVPEIVPSFCVGADATGCQTDRQLIQVEATFSRVNDKIRRRLMANEMDLSAETRLIA